MLNSKVCLDLSSRQDLREYAVMLKTKALEDVDNPIICHVLKLTINFDFPRETNINKYMLSSIIFYHAGLL